jgi:hypothetical protein
MFDALIVLRQDIRSGLLMSLGLHESNCSGPRGTLIFDMTQDIRGDFPQTLTRGDCPSERHWECGLRRHYSRGVRKWYIDLCQFNTGKNLFKLWFE